MKPPVWLLDIDGVINAVGRTVATNAWPKESWRQLRYRDRSSTGSGLQITVALPVLDLIREVHEAGLAEVRWHTSWQDAAPRLAVELGLPVFAVAAAPEFHAGTRQGWWKVPAVRRVLADEGRAVVWTDDDASHDLGHTERAELAALGRLLIVSPDPLTGLCKRHLAKISEFLNQDNPFRVGVVLPA